MDTDAQFAALEALAKSPNVKTEPESESAKPAVVPDEAAQNKVAAQEAARAINSKPDYLKLGFWPGHIWRTPIPIPHAVGNTLAGMGAEGWRIGQGLYDEATGAKPNPTDLAVRKQLGTGPAGETGAFLTDALLTAPVGGAVDSGLARAGSLGERIAGNLLSRAAAEGATQGALMAKPGNRTLGAAEGAAGGALLPLAGRPIGWLVKGLKRTPEAQALLDRGVDLTPGLLNPEGQRNISESAAQSLPFMGAMVARARNNALRGFQRSVVQEAAAPGATIAPRDVHDMLTDAYNSFQPLYEEAKGFDVKPLIMHEGADENLTKALASAVKNKVSTASPSERRDASKFLADELGRFDGKSDSLLKMRSDIRTEIRKLNREQKYTKAELLEAPEQIMTQALESQLPKSARDALKVADSKYGAYKTIEDAVARAKDRPLGMTGTNLQEAVAAQTPKPIYARGGGGPLRELARQGKQVFDLRSPPTGARVETMLPGMWAAEKHPFLTAIPAAARMGLTVTRPGRMLAAGTLPAQRAVQRALGAASPALLEAAGRYARAGLLSPVLSGAVPLLTAQGTGAQ